MKLKMKRHPHEIIDSYKGREYSVPSPVGEYLSAYYSNWKVKESQTACYVSPNDDAISRKARES